MQRLILIFLICALMAACATVKPPTVVLGWDQRVSDLQKSTNWQLEGRAAVAVGPQGWQASLAWHERGENAEVHLSGPFGIGALVLKRTAEGLSLNGAPPNDAVLSQLQERLGFDLPLDNLRFWLLGVPDPASTFELERNAQDRAQHIAQNDWSIDYDRYMASGADLLPAHMVLSREGVRVRIVVDHWDLR
jgi:outer membrane lipoprotein LolB